jgi:hypothetical protein
MALIPSTVSLLLSAKFAMVLKKVPKVARSTGPPSGSSSKKSNNLHKPVHIYKERFDSSVRATILIATCPSKPEHG